MRGSVQRICKYLAHKLFPLRPSYGAGHWMLLKQARVQGMLYLSRDIRALSSSHRTALPASLMNFVCRDHAGAVLWFEPPAISMRIVSKRHIVNYIHTHYDAWSEYTIPSRGASASDATPDRLVFIAGTSHASRWACAGFSGAYRNIAGTLTCDPRRNPVLSVSVGGTPVPTRSFPPSTTSSQVPHCYGPEAVLPPNALEDLPPSAGATQGCVFIHYFKAKRRHPRSSHGHGHLVRLQQSSQFGHPG